MHHLQCPLRRSERVGAGLEFGALWLLRQVSNLAQVRTSYVNVFDRTTTLSQFSSTTLSRNRRGNTTASRAGGFVTTSNSFKYAPHDERRNRMSILNDKHSPTSTLNTTLHHNTQLNGQSAYYYDAARPGVNHYSSPQQQPLSELTSSADSSTDSLVIHERETSMQNM